MEQPPGYSRGNALDADGVGPVWSPVYDDDDKDACRHVYCD